MANELDITALIQQDEGQFFDRKSLWEGPPASKRRRDKRTVRDQIVKYVAAFANAEGGLLILGLEDDGAVTGHGYHDEAVDEMLAAPQRRLDPPQSPGRRVEHAGQELLVFDVDAAVRAVMVTGDGFPYRRHDQVVMMGQVQINALKQLGMTESAEAQQALELSLADLDATLIARAREGAGLLAISDEAYLLRRRLADRRGGALVLRQAAALLFAQAPQSIDNPNASVRVFKVRGKVRLTGARHNVQELPQIEGNIVQVIEQTHQVLFGQIQRSAKLHDLFFREVPEYPDFAWQEAIVNAVAHRDYAVQSRAIEVWLFDDHLEVTSPGGLLAEVRLADIVARRRVHASRNPRITRVATDLGVMREQGEGIPRMIEEMETSWLPVPEFSVDERTFSLVLRNTPIFETADPEWARSVEQLDLNLRQKRILVARVGDAFTNGDYQTINQVDRDTAYKEIRQLVDVGLVERTGSAGRSVSYRVAQREPSLERSISEPVSVLQELMKRQGQLTNADMQHALGLSRNGALEVLRELVGQQVLEQQGSGRGAHYVQGSNWEKLPKVLNTDNAD